MSKEKPNGVESTPIEQPKEGMGQVKEGKIEAKRAYNSPRTPKEVWRKVKAEFEAGTYLDLKQLSQKYGVNHGSLRQKVCNEKWNEKQIALDNKVSQVIEKKVLKEVDLASEYLSNSFKRAVRYEAIADASIAQAGTNSEGIPLVDPDQLDQVTRSLVRLHELAKSSLRLPTVAMDITSNGQGLGDSFISAISKLRGDPSQPALSQGDLSKVLEAEVE